MSNQPALKTALILMAGIYSGHIFQVTLPALLISCLSLTLLTGLLYILKRQSLLFELLLILSLVSAGGLRYQQVTRYDPPNHIRHLLDFNRPMTIKGILIKDPEGKSNHTECILRSEKWILPDTAYSIRGDVLIAIYTQIPHPFQYGDEIQVTGQLRLPSDQRNPGGFDYRAYLRRKNIFGIVQIYQAGQMQWSGLQKGNSFLREIIYPIRRLMIETINQTTREPYRSLLQALLVGERGTISPEIRESFAKAGVIHVLAVSGLHVGFILLILITLFGLFRLPYPVRVLLTIGGLIFYAFLTEMRAPVNRATIMATVYLIGTLIERRSNPFNTIGVAALIILFLRPQELFDIGFQLSFTAVISIVYFYTKLSALPVISTINQKLKNKPMGSYCLPLFLVSLSAQLGTIPLTAYYFNRIPFLSLIVNLFAIPIVGLIVALGFTTLMTALINPWVAMIYGTLNETILSIYTAIIGWIGNLPFSHMVVPTPDISHWLVYFSLVLFLIHIQNRTRRKQFLFLFLVSLNLLVWKNGIWNNATKITWIQFDVGQGDAALLRLPREKYILIDGGDKTPSFDNGESVVAPYLRQNGIRSLDAVILTHPHNDHVGGLIYILNHFKVRQVLTAGTPFDSPLMKAFSETIKQENIPVRTILAPDSLTAFPGIKIYFLSPAESAIIQDNSRYVNNRSLVARILFGKTRLLFMGDAEREAEKKLIGSSLPLSCDAIKVGHHGSGTSSIFPFLSRVNPAHAVISVGEYNPHGHPSKSVLQRFKMQGTTVHRTDQEGAVIFRSDGEMLTKVKWK